MSIAGEREGLCYQEQLRLLVLGRQFLTDGREDEGYTWGFVDSWYYLVVTTNEQVHKSDEVR